MFTTLKTYGETFPVDFWDTVCQELLFPIFAVLKSAQDVSRFSTQEDMSVWLSTTMIQALRDLIDLYTFYFETLERFLDGLLDLLCVCICQGMMLRGAPRVSLSQSYRKRHPRADRYFVFTATIGEQREEAEHHSLGASHFHVRKVVQDYDTASALRRRAEGRDRRYRFQHRRHSG